MAIAQRLDPELRVKRVGAFEPGFTAEPGIQSSPFPGPVSLPGDFWVIEYRQHRRLGTLIHQRFEQTCGIGGTPCTRVILGIGQHHRFFAV